MGKIDVMRGLLVAAIIALGAASACTPEEIQAYAQITGPTTAAADARGFTPDVMAQLRYCESLDNYTFVNGPGAIYRGAYQFTQGTWDNAAAKHFPWLVGTDPAAAPFYWQDAMARAVWAEYGSEPWQECVGPNTWCASWGCKPQAQAATKQD